MGDRDGAGEGMCRHARPMIKTPARLPRIFAMSKNDDRLPTRSSNEEVDAFLAQVARTPAAAPGQRGRLIFAMDATASREPTWDQACHIQAEMFDATAAIGGLDVQLCWYRGFGEFSAEPWSADTRSLQQRMSAVRCLGGATQIGRVLQHAGAETRRRKVNALVFVGDCMEENPDQLYALAGELGLLGLPAFVFQEGVDASVRRVFESIARLSGGAYCHFDAGSARQLRELLAAVAVYAAGGRRALEHHERRHGGATRLLTQLKGG